MTRQRVVRWMAETLWNRGGQLQRLAMLLDRRVVRLRQAETPPTVTHLRRVQ